MVTPANIVYFRFKATSLAPPGDAGVRRVYGRKQAWTTRCAVLHEFEENQIRIIFLSVSKDIRKVNNNKCKAIFNYVQLNNLNYGDRRFAW